MTDEFKRAAVLSTACCWDCDKPKKATGDKSGLRQMFHQLARAKMRRDLYALATEED